MRHGRHPVLENLVFGLAGVLALILAYYAYARWDAGRRSGGAPEAPLGRGPVEEEAPPPDTGNLRRSGTMRAVSSLPTVKLSAPKKRRS